MGRLWQRWKKLNLQLINIQATLFLTVFYWTAFVAYALFFKLLSDPLATKQKYQSFWFNKDTKNIESQEALEKQY